MATRDENSRDAYERGEPSFGTAGSITRIVRRLEAKELARRMNQERQAKWALVVTGSAPISILRETR